MSMTSKINKSEIPSGPLSFFHALFSRCTAFYGHFLVDVITSQESTCISSSAVLWFVNLRETKTYIENKKKKKISVQGQLKKTTIYNLIFLIHFILLKRKQSYEMRNQHRRSYFTVTKVFLGLGPILITGQKYWLTIKFLQTFFT